MRYTTTAKGTTIPRVYAQIVLWAYAISILTLGALVGLYLAHLFGTTPAWAMGLGGIMMAVLYLFDE